MAKALTQVRKVRTQANKLVRKLTSPKLPGVVGPARKLVRRVTGK